MCVELILQAILHESDDVQWSFIFSRTQNLAKTWKTSIVVTLIYFKNLWLKMENVKSLHQSLVTILMSSQNNIATLIMHRGQLGKKKTTNQRCE